MVMGINFYRLEWTNAKRVCLFFERLVDVTPDLLRKSPPEGVVDHDIGLQASPIPREPIQFIALPKAA